MFPLISQADVGVALSLFVVVAVFFLYTKLWPNREAKRKAARYPLFAVRDQLVRLVADGKIEEDDEVFQFLYRGINRLIPEIKPLTLTAIVQALSTNPLLEAQFLEKFLAAVDDRDPAVRETAKKLFEELDKILLARSRFVHLSTRLDDRKRTLPPWVKQVTSNRSIFNPLKTRYKAVLLYRELQKASMRLAAPDPMASLAH